MMRWVVWGDCPTGRCEYRQFFFYWRASRFFYRAVRDLQPLILDGVTVSLGPL